MNLVKQLEDVFCTIVKQVVNWTATATAKWKKIKPGDDDQLIIYHW